MKVTDPVCGMQVDIKTTTLSSEYQGQAYYFCKRACQKAFDANPENYISRSISVTGHGTQEYPIH